MYIILFLLILINSYRLTRNSFSFYNIFIIFNVRCTIMNYFSENLLYYRKCRNMTQSDLASKLYVKRQTVSNYEQNTRVCNLDMLVLISDVLRVPLDDLVKYPHP